MELSHLVKAETPGTWGHSCVSTPINLPTHLIPLCKSPQNAYLVNLWKSPISTSNIMRTALNFFSYLKTEKSFLCCRLHKNRQWASSKILMRNKNVSKSNRDLWKHFKGVRRGVCEITSFTYFKKFTRGTMESECRGLE